MKIRILTKLLLAIVPVGCGGGGGATGPTDAVPQESAPETVVVQFDENDDGEPDWIALDTSTRPYRVVEALYGSANGEPVNVTDLLRGRAIDVDVSNALADHMASTFEVTGRAEIDVVLADQTQVNVVVLD
ncbi:MAG: hypothetical protein ACYTGZ_06215 [Planctomycetota bacterium]|jgi:hypothetical protein